MRVFENLDNVFLIRGLYIFSPYPRIYPDLLERVSVGVVLGKCCCRVRWVFSFSRDGWVNIYIVPVKALRFQEGRVVEGQPPPNVLCLIAGKHMTFAVPGYVLTFLLCADFPVVFHRIAVGKSSDRRSVNDWVKQLMIATIYLEMK